MEYNLQNFLVYGRFSQSRIFRGICQVFKLRVSVATERLIQLAKNHHSVLLIGHGIMNCFLRKELISNGWLGEAAPNGNKYWGYKYW